MSGFEPGPRKIVDEVLDTALAVLEPRREQHAQRAAGGEALLPGRGRGRKEPTVASGSASGQATPELARRASGDGLMVVLDDWGWPRWVAA